MDQNRGPYRTGEWGKVKRKCLDRWLRTHTSTSPEFRRIASKLRLCVGRDGEGLSDDELFKYMGGLATCNEVGPVLELARWGSIHECWGYFKREYYGT